MRAILSRVLLSICLVSTTPLLAQETTAWGSLANGWGMVQSTPTVRGLVSADHSVFANPVTVTITNATNATPIVVTADAHGLVTGDAISISGITGNTNANGYFKITRLTADTFSLQNYSTGADIAGNGAYGGTPVATAGIVQAGQVMLMLGGSIRMSAVSDNDSGISLAGFRSFAFGSGIGGDTSGTVTAANVSATAAVSGSTLNIFGGGVIKFYGSTSYDLGLSRGATAKSLVVGNGTAGNATGSIGAAAYSVVGANGALQTNGYTTEALTLSTGGTTTATSATLAPASSRILAITGRVVTTITTATNYSVAPTGAAAWVLAGTTTSTLTGLAAGSTFTLVPASGASYTQESAATLTVTTNAPPGAGAIRFVVFYDSFTPPTS